MGLAAAGSSLVGAADYSLLGFGTVGYAVSDQKPAYLRYIDSKGTLKADSLIGLQGEAQFDPQWGATVQVVGSAPQKRDNGLEAQVRWAFASYRPNSDWLLRAGRLRVPFLLDTQNAEVGATYDQARLPTEVYSLFPVYDADGAAFTKTWDGNGSEFRLDGYVGKTDIKFRNPFHADPALRLFPDPYLPEKVEVAGLILSYSRSSLLLRGGVHKAVLRASGSQLFVDGFTPSQIPAPAPFGGAVYGPGNIINKIDVNVLTAAVDWHPGDWRFTTEYVQRFVRDSTIGIGSKSAYVTVARSVGKWTPYITYARLLSAPETRKLYDNLNRTPVPLAAQGPPAFLPATFHKILAGQIFVYDQFSVMVGTSYDLSLSSKLKFEWMYTKVGLASVLVDGDVHHKGFNVFSMSYNFAF